MKSFGVMIVLAALGAAEAASAQGRTIPVERDLQRLDRTERRIDREFGPPPGPLPGPTRDPSGVPGFNGPPGMIGDSVGSYTPLPPGSIGNDDD